MTPQRLCSVFLVAIALGIGGGVLDARAGAATASPRRTTSAASRRPGVAKASCAMGVRLALGVRFPVGFGLGLAVCTVGAVIEIDDWLHARLMAR